MMRKLFARRWATVGLLAAGLIGLTAASASADVEYFTNPPDGSAILGPGCSDRTGNLDFGFYLTSGADWQPTSSADYSGPDVYHDENAPGACDGTSYNALTQDTQTATFWWSYRANVPYTQSCQIYAWIPTVNAGDYHARYDFWAMDNNGQVTSWLAWPGDTVDQEDYAGWTHIGGANVPANTPYLTVTLSNADPAAPGWWAGAGDMAFSCTQAGE
jgi:hypothetical protein